jgi:signal transduction histidine kinase
MTIQTKTTLLFTLLTAGFISVVSIVVYFFSSNFAFRDFYKRLEIRAYIVASATLGKDERSTSVYQDIREQKLEKLSQEREFIFKTNNGNVSKAAADSAHIPVRFLQEVAAEEKATYFSRGLYYSGILHRDSHGNYVVVVSARNDYGEEVLANLRQILLACWLVSTLVVFIAGLAFSRTIFQPIRNIVSRVKEISAENLHLRLPVRKGGDEIAVLSNTFNDLLSRLEAAFDIQRNFVSNASHELRTPLTAIIGEADLALYKERTPEAYRESLQAILKDAEKLQYLTTSLLSLAQTTNAGNSLKTEQVRLDELLLDVKQMVERMDDNYRLVLQLPDVTSLADAPYTTGSYPLLLLAVSNVVKNAFKYSAKPVTVRLEGALRQYVITVTDEGIGIPDEELKYIFVPFFRASNVGNYDGHGIGLPLTANIVRFHNGQIIARSAVHKGTEVRIVLPAVRPYV